MLTGFSKDKFRSVFQILVLVGFSKVSAILNRMSGFGYCFSLGIGFVRLAVTKMLKIAADRKLIRRM